MVQIIIRGTKRKRKPKKEEIMKKKKEEEEEQKKDLDRFAGSSSSSSSSEDVEDDDDDDDNEAEKAEEHMTSDDEVDDDINEKGAVSSDPNANKISSSKGFSLNKHDNDEKNPTVDDDDDTSSIDDVGNAVVDPSAKMASVMGRILGSMGDSTKTKNPSTGVVLAKTVTPLQKLQQEEKEKEKAMKEKRKANRERNLSALHYPLSIATSSNVLDDGRPSVAKELEQERFYRRVATRGVVALFNAISQHQRSSTEKKEDDDDVAVKKKKNASKLTKHDFLDKIKSAAVAASNSSNNTNHGSNNTRTDDADVSDSKTKRKQKSDERKGNNSSVSTPTWGALKDDYMLNPKKNWDEESSDEEVDCGFEENETNEEEVPTTRKKIRSSR